MPARKKKRPARERTAAPKRAARPKGDAEEIERLRETIRLAEARFAGIVGISADAIVSVDQSQRIVFFNAGAERIFGYRTDEILGELLTRLLPTTAGAVHDTHVRAFGTSEIDARHMGARRPIEGRRKSGELFPAEASISHVDLGGKKLYTAVLRDVTERARLLSAAMDARAQAEAAERRSRYLSEASEALDRSLDYETTLSALAKFVVPQLADLSVIDVIEPDGAVRRIGLAHADREQQPLVELLRRYPLDGDRPFLTRRALVTGEMDRVAVATPELIRSLTQDAEHFAAAVALDPTSWLVVPLRAHDEVIGAMAFVRCGEPRPYSDADVLLATELARRAAQAVENTRLYGAARSAIRARDDVLAVVSHDLRNPLSAIAMCVTTLLEQPPTDELVRHELLDMVRQSVEWMHRIIQDLLDIASIEAGKLSVHPARTAVAEIIALARPSFEALAADRQFDVGVAPSTPAVDADADRIAQVLVNLVGNAAKFTPPQGTVSVRVAPDAAGIVRFTVRDSGSGISAGDLPHIFDRYWHQRGASLKAGSGLGLAIAKGIVEAHGGRIWAESVAGLGSTFAFTIPASE